eukprot:TRINITY_DN14071_c0_g1_i3.p1 TRINITY_DN14071_c0_g1~~TRINITY_DN14071_c0_g1_i3.p1  ORF type:complete len:499 (-),score=69.80 TRINITY_DN14071_c0_g1_i3:229-1698(-)
MKNYTLKSIVVVFLGYILAPSYQTNVAIVGAGIGGSSVAYYLSELYGDKLDLTVFDSGPVGGRLATTHIAGREYETGGSIIHPANRLMVEHLERCGFKKSKSHEDGPFSMISNGQIVFQASDGFFDKIKSVIRYGLFSLLKLDYFVGNLLENFATIYPKLEAGESFESVAALLDGMSPISKHGDSSHEMLQLTKISTKKKLQELSISEILIDELGMVAAKVNYGQFPDTLHGFVGSVSLAGIQGGLWNVEGGNYKIPKCLLAKSGATFLPASVNSIEYTNGKSNVTYHLLDNPNNPISNEFDIVIIATPLTIDKTILKLRINGEDQSFPGSFQRTLAYIVHGELNSDFGDDPNDNLFFIDKDDVVASVSMLTPVNYDPATDHELPHVFKLFARQELSKEELGKYFSKIEELQLIDWLAYPNYSTFAELASFKLGENLFYVNNIEWAASAMEMSSLAARNIANLVGQSILDNTEKVSNKKPSSQDNNTEL